MRRRAKWPRNSADSREVLLASLTGGGIVLAIEAGSLGDPGICLIVTPSNPDVLTKAHDALLNIARRMPTRTVKPTRSSRSTIAVFTVIKSARKWCTAS